MALNPSPMRAPDGRLPREIPALDLASLVQRHAAGFGRVRACGDWSDPCFRRTTGPLLLAFARHAHLLPLHVDDPCGSLLDAGLDACADAVLAAATQGPGAVGDRAGRVASRIAGRVAGRIETQDAVVLHALAPWVVAATSRWQVCLQDGRPALALSARPLCDRIEAAAASSVAAAAPASYRVQPCASAGAAIDRGPGVYPLGIVLLMRSLPGPAMAAACGGSPSLPAAAMALSTQVACAQQAGPDAASRDLRGAMHALIAEGRWTVNVRRSRLWFLDGRLFLAWKTAAGELSARLALEPALLLPLLVRQGIVIDRADAAAAGYAAPVLAIRTPFTEALPVVELADAAAWLRSVPRAGCSA